MAGAAKNTARVLVGSGGMADYRVYFLDASNHIATAKELECASDDDAIAAALQFEDDRDLELWSGARLVARLAALDRKRSARPRATEWSSQGERSAP
jgi:hypothetical protein